MALVYKWDQRSMHRVRYSLRGLEIHRGCLVTGVTVTNQIATGTDPEVWLRVMADANCPVIGTAVYPTTIPRFANTVLEEIIPETMGPNQPNNSARFDFVYRNPIPPGGGAGGTNVWTMTDSGTGSWVEAQGTAHGLAAIAVWYRKGQSSATTTLPADDDPARPVVGPKGVRGIHRYFVQRSLRVTGRLLGADWEAISTAVRDTAGCINSASWGSYGRGYWLFMFPVSRTSDFGKTYDIELNFLYDPYKHFPIGYYYDRNGERPSDVATDADIRGGTLPAEGAYEGRNGIVMASVQDEEDFNDIFAFVPD